MCKRIRAKKHGLGMKFKVFSLSKNQTVRVLLPHTTKAHFKRDVETCRNEQINMKALKHIRDSLSQERWKVFPIKE